jgi:succinyldiaminopimelate transaminase
MPLATGFDPPPYPFERLGPIAAIARAHDGGMVDLSIGTPCDLPPQVVVDALSAGATLHGYPNSVGSDAYRQAAAAWATRRFGVAHDPAHVGACVGTKEFVATTPQYLHLRYPDRDTVLYPQISYPTYAMGADLAGLRAVPVSLRPDGSLDLASIAPDDVARALCLWSNSPSNPTGQLDDLAAVAAWARESDVIVLSDECYTEFVWATDDARYVAAPTMMSDTPTNVVVVHSLSKRSNAAGIRAGFFAGDQDLVHYLREVRKHAGFMVPGPVQSAAVAAWNDDQHVVQQREIYRRRLSDLAAVVSSTYGMSVQLPQGGFYLWIKAPAGQDGWSFAETLARDLGVLGSPGDFYGDASSEFVRLAVVQSDASLELVRERASKVAR